MGLFDTAGLGAARREPELGPELAALLAFIQVDPTFRTLLTTRGFALVDELRHEGDTVGFFATTPVAQQVVAALTNNITAGGSDDVLTNWTSLISYSTDAAAIRNAVYQLGRKVAQLRTALAAYGLLT